MMKRCLVFSAILLVARGAAGAHNSTVSLSRAIIHMSLGKQAQNESAAELEKYYVSAYKTRAKVDLSFLEHLSFDFIDQQALHEICMSAIQQCSQQSEDIEYLSAYRDRATQAVLHGVGSVLFRDEKVAECMTAKLCSAYGIDNVSHDALDRAVFFEGAAYALYLLSKDIPSDLLLGERSEGQELIALLSHTAWAVKYVSSLEGKCFAPEASAQLVMSVFDELCGLVV